MHEELYKPVAIITNWESAQQVIHLDLSFQDTLPLYVVFITLKCNRRHGSNVVSDGHAPNNGNSYWKYEATETEWVGCFLSCASYITV
jgi:hypothetical protein